MKRGGTRGMSYEMSLFFLGIYVLFHTSYASPGGGVKPKFNYSDPTQWGKLLPMFEECSSGTKQSPINIITANTVVNQALGPLDSFYQVQNASLFCNGLVVEVTVNGKTELVLGGKTFHLFQMHYHTPSEHLINGIQFPAELHQVHKAEDGSITVIGILYEYGKPDPLVSTIHPYMVEMYKKHAGGFQEETVTPIAKFPSMLIKDRPSKYYRYTGSLTTPPCFEHVTWTVLSEARTMSKEQVEGLRDLLDPVNKKNARPVQPLHHRIVERFG